MVRAAGRPLAPAADIKTPAQAGNGGALQGLVGIHGRQQSRKTLRQHGFTGAGRPHQQQAVPTGSGNFQRPLSGQLAFDVGHIRQLRGTAGAGTLHPNPALFSRTAARLGNGRLGAFGHKLAHHIDEATRHIDLRARHQRRLLGAIGRQHQAGVHLGLVQGQRHGQRAAHRTQPARERQLASKLVFSQPVGFNLSARRQNAQCDRQIQAPRVFGQVCRGQIDGDALVVGKLQAAVLDGAAHPLARLFHLHIGQAHQREAGKAIGHMHFDGDLHRLQTEQGAALYQR